MILVAAFPRERMMGARGIAPRIAPRVSRSRPWSGLTSFRKFLHRSRIAGIIFAAPRRAAPRVRIVRRS